MIQSGFKKMEPWDKKTGVSSVLGKIERQVRRKKWKNLFKTFLKRKKKK